MLATEQTDTPRVRGVDVWLALFVAIQLIAVLPLFLVKYPPSHDFPQHLAAVHMLRVYPEQGLGEELALDLTRTQYIGVYALAALFARALGDVLGTKLVVAAIAVSVPAGLWALLRTLRKDERIAFFALPLTLSAPLLFGLYNYMAGIGLLLFSLAAAVRLSKAFSGRRFIMLSFLLSAMVFTHPVPSAFALFGCALVLVQRDLRNAARNLLSLVPLVMLTIAWTFHATAAEPATDLPDSDTSRTFIRALEKLPTWLTCVLRGDVDDVLFWAWVGLALFLTSWGLFSRSPLRRGEGTLRVALLASLAWGLYFVLPEKHLWVYPVASRFAVLACVLSIIVLPEIARTKMSVLTILLSALVVVQAQAHAVAFRGVSREQGDVDQAIARIPEGRRVAGLIFDQGSKFVTFRAFRHYASLYQAQKGGIVSRSFVGLPTSPFVYKHEAPLQPPWFIKDRDIDPATDFPSFEYVLVRGGPGRIAAPESPFVSVYQGKRWRVYRRVR